ncbi:MAG: D-aminoacyl-tRNA deacylase [Acidobacteriota bacterium]
MKVLLQRVSRASVTVDDEVVGAIEKGLLLFVGVEQDDSETEVETAVSKLVGLRVFSDDRGRMNLDVKDVGGEVLVVSQFTLAGSLRKGRRPSFEGAAEPERARELVDLLAARLREAGLTVAEGRFAADMKVELLNDGPVTFLLDLPFGPRRSS